MDKKFLSHSLYFGVNSAREANNSAGASQTSEALIQKARQLHEKWLQQAKNARAVVNADRQFRNGNEFKRILMEVQNLNEQERRRLENMVSQESAQLEALTKEIQAKYQKNGQIDYDKLALDKDFQAVNARKLLLHEMRKVHTQERIQLNVEHSKRVALVQENTRQETKKLKRDVDKNKNITTTTNGKEATVKQREEYKDYGSKLEFGKDGRITTESLLKKIADLDGMSGVEKENVGWWSRTFRGMNEQKFAVGESQLYEVMKDAGFDSKAKIDGLYHRLTGDASGTLDFTTNDRQRDDRHDEWKDSLNRSAQRKIKTLQQAIVSRADALADVMQVLYTPDGKSKIQGMGEARAGLVSVINGTEAQFLSALENPANAEKFLQILKSSEVIKRDKNIVSKILGFLSKIGLAGAVNVMSGGLLGVRLENQDLNANDLANAKVLQANNLSVEKGVGENSRVGASFDLVAARAYFNWNDPKQTIETHLVAFKKTPDKMQASQDMVNSVNKAMNEKWFGQKNIAEIGKNFLNAQAILNNQLQKLPTSDPRRQQFENQMQQNGLIYMATVLKEKGTNLQGIDVIAWLAGLSFGLSAAKINTSATTDGVNEGAARIEAMANLKELSDEELKQSMQQLGLSIGADGSVLREGKVLLTPAANQKISWFQVKEYHTGYKNLTLEARLIDKTTGVVGGVIRINNKGVVHEELERNSATVVSEIQKIKLSGTAQQKSYLRQIQEASSQEPHDFATVQSLIPKLFGEKSVVTQALQNSTTPEKQENFMDMFLAQTSGGRNSHELADAFEKKTNYAKNLRDLKKYYETRVADVFAKSYGLSRGDVMALFNRMTVGTKSLQVGKLGDNAPGGFNALVAYSQSHGFRKLDHVDNTNAQFFGNMTEVRGARAKEAIRQKMMANISPTQIQDVRSQLLAAYGSDAKNHPEINNDNYIKKQIVSGPVEAYLSYEPNAECFNLGFRIKPGFEKIPSVQQTVDNKKWSGSTVGREQANKTEFGVNIGLSWDKIRGKDKPKPNELDKPSNPSTTPGADPVKEGHNVNTIVSGENVTDKVSTEALKEIPTWWIGASSKNFNNISKEVDGTSFF